jgi:prophage maintenance system killer protein
VRLHLTLLSVGLLILLPGAEQCLADKKADCLAKLFGIEFRIRAPVQALNYLEHLWKRPMPARKRSALEKIWARIDADRPEINYPETLSLPKTDNRRHAVESVTTAIDKTRQGLSRTISDTDNEAKLARRNFAEAEVQVHKWVRSKVPLTLERVKKLNAILGRDLRNNDDDAGHFRELEVETDEASYLPMKMVPRAMEHLIHWYGKNEDELHPIELAAQMYQRMVSIHPFPDANGRTARFVMDWILEFHGYPPASFQGEFFVGTFPNVRDKDNPVPGLAEERVTAGVLWSVDLMKSALLKARQKDL